MMLHVSKKTQSLTQSGIRSASIQCAAIKGINLGQGVCDLPTPDPIKKAATDAINANKNTYSACEGVKALRDALSKKLADFNQVTANPDNQIMISHGATGAYVCAAQTLFEAGDEIIIFEPFYGYHKNILELFGLTVKSVPMSLDDFSIDFDRVRATISKKTKAIVICTPCNPSGKVFTREELLEIGEIARQNNLIIFADEIYEYFTYPGYKHVSIASLDDHFDRTITLSGFSKTYNMTGWRLGYVSGPAEVLTKMSLMQDLLYVCPATPLQHALVSAFDMPMSYFDEMQKVYLKKRDMMVERLSGFGFKTTIPEGAYYIMAGIKDLPFENDLKAAEFLMQKAKVATVPGRSFYINPEDGQNILRICYALNTDVLEQALQQIQHALKYHI